MNELGLWNVSDTGQPNYCDRKLSCHSAGFSTVNPTWKHMGSNPGLRGDRPATDPWRGRDVISKYFVYRHQYFGGKCYLHLQCRNALERKGHASPKLSHYTAAILLKELDMKQNERSKSAVCVSWLFLTLSRSFGLPFSSHSVCDRDCGTPSPPIQKSWALNYVTSYLLCASNLTVHLSSQLLKSLSLTHCRS